MYFEFFWSTFLRPCTRLKKSTLKSEILELEFQNNLTQHGKCPNFVFPKITPPLWTQRYWNWPNWVVESPLGLGCLLIGVVFPSHFFPRSWSLGRGWGRVDTTTPTTLNFGKGGSRLFHVFLWKIGFLYGIFKYICPLDKLILWFYLIVPNIL